MYCGHLTGLRPIVSWTILQDVTRGRAGGENQLYAAAVRFELTLATAALGHVTTRIPSSNREPSIQPI